MSRTSYQLYSPSGGSDPVFSGGVLWGISLLIINLYRYNQDNSTYTRSKTSA
jgi:hypothetical protein